MSCTDAWYKTEEIARSEKCTVTGCAGGKGGGLKASLFPYLYWDKIAQIAIYFVQ